MCPGLTVPACRTPSQDTCSASTSSSERTLCIRTVQGMSWRSLCAATGQGTLARHSTKCAVEMRCRVSERQSAVWFGGKGCECWRRRVTRMWGLSLLQRLIDGRVVVPGRIRRYLEKVFSRVSPHGPSFSRVLIRVVERGICF